MKNKKHFGDTELGQGIGCATVIIAIALFFLLLAYGGYVSRHGF